MDNSIYTCNHIGNMRYTITHYIVNLEAKLERIKVPGIL